jgi:Leucine-rich repeat (LRR) protein
MINNEILIYDSSSNKKYPIYPNTDLKFKNKRNINLKKITTVDHNISQLVNKNINNKLILDDMDTIKYRVNECNNSGGKMLDLTCLELTKLPHIIPSDIEYLFCSDNKLVDMIEVTSLKKLKILDCSNNMLRAIPKLSPILEELSCRNNYIKNLDQLIECKKLERLDCSQNKIMNIPKIDSMMNLNCANNKICKLPVLTNLKKLNCEHNEIVELCEYLNLEELECNNNQINFIQNYKKLCSLFCENNFITKMCNLPQIKIIHCHHNKLRTIIYFSTLDELVCDYKKINKISKRYKIKYAKHYNNGNIYLIFE